jgi:hypothetical protein
MSITFACTIKPKGENNRDVAHRTRAFMLAQEVITKHDIDAVEYVFLDESRCRLVCVASFDSGVQAALELFKSEFVVLVNVEMLELEEMQ